MLVTNAGGPPPATALDVDDEGLDRARSRGLPVMIEFTADWCVPCKELEHTTFAHPDVVQAAANVVALKADATTGGTAEVEAAEPRDGLAD